jgi:transposase
MLKRCFRAERDPVVRLRLQFLWRVRLGDSLAAAAALVGVSDRAGRAWIRRYRQGGLEALRRKQTRRHRFASKLTEEQWEQLRAHLQKGTCRTAAQIAVWIEENFGVRYHRNSLYVALARRRIRLKVPRPRSNKAALAAQAAWKKGCSPSSSPKP